jgi:FixJ family two-component response regulator
VNPKTHPGIAIIDDEKSYADLLAVTLGECFLNPIHAFTQPQAFLDALPMLDLCLVVTDFHMPRINGHELIARTRRERPGLPFLLITGHFSELPEEELLKVPELRGILHKPFGWRKLATEILRVAPASPRL